MTPKMERFCQEFIRDLNATQAAIRSGYSKSTARSIGSENLSKPDIKLRIAELKQERADRLQVDASWVLERLMNIASVSAGSLKKDWDVLKAWEELTDEEKEAISEITIDKSSGGSGDDAWSREKKSFKLYDKTKVLEMISKHIGFYGEDNKQKVDPLRDISVTIVDGAKSE